MPIPLGISISFCSESCISNVDREKEKPLQVCACWPVVKALPSRSQPDRWHPSTNPGNTSLRGHFAGLLGQKIRLPYALMKELCLDFSLKSLALIYEIYCVISPGIVCPLNISLIVLKVMAFKMLYRGDAKLDWGHCSARHYTCREIAARQGGFQTLFLLTSFYQTFRRLLKTDGDCGSYSQQLADHRGKKSHAIERR